MFSFEYKNSKSLEKTEAEKRRIKVIENGKKSLEIIKKRQRFNFQTFVEEQINQDLMLKTNIAKEMKMKELEEENLRELNKKKLDRERRVTAQAQKRQEKMNKKMEEQDIKRKEIEEKEIQRKNDLIEEDKKNQITLKNKAELENIKFHERKKRNKSRIKARKKRKRRTQ